MTDKVIHDSGSVDTFADTTPVELPNSDTPQGGGKNTQGLETFDDQEVKTLDDVKEEETEEPDDGKEEKKVKRETDKLEDQEDDDDEDSEEESDEEEGDDKASEDEDESESEDSGAKPRGKTIRVKDGDEKLDISEDADIPVKIKGRKEFVSLKDLRDNYSGQRAWTEEINTAKQQNADLQEQVQQFEQQKEQTRAHFAKIGEMVHKGFEDPEADPLEAMKYLVDLSGRSVLDFEKRMIDHYGRLAGSFSEMSEAEQNLYWTQRENQILKDSQAAKARESEERTAQEQRSQKILQTMERYGISEEDFEAAELQISQQGYDMNQVTAEQICKWSVCAPYFEEAQTLVSQFADDLSDDEVETLISGTVDTMYKIPEISAQEALQMKAKQMGYEIYSEEDIVNDLKNRHKGGEDRLQNRKKSKVAEKHAESRGFESFDDYEDELYG